MKKNLVVSALILSLASSSALADGRGGPGKDGSKTPITDQVDRMLDGSAKWAKETWEDTKDISAAAFENFESNFDKGTQAKAATASEAVTAGIKHTLGFGAEVSCFVLGKSRAASGHALQTESLNFLENELPKLDDKGRIALVKKIIDHDKSIIEKELRASRPSPEFAKSEVSVGAYAQQTSNVIAREKAQNSLEGVKAKLIGLNAAANEKITEMVDIAKGAAFYEDLNDLKSPPPNSVYVVIENPPGSAIPFDADIEEFKPTAPVASANAGVPGEAPVRALVLTLKATDPVTAGYIAKSEDNINKLLDEIDAFEDQKVAIQREIARANVEIERFQAGVDAEDFEKAKIIRDLVENPKSPDLSPEAKSFANHLTHVAAEADQAKALENAKKGTSMVRTGRWLQVAGAAFFVLEATEVAANICHAKAGKDLSLSPIGTGLVLPAAEHYGVNTSNAKKALEPATTVTIASEAAEMIRRAASKTNQTESIELESPDILR